MGWTPSLSISEVGHGCRLTLGGIAYGEGHELQDACDALVARVLDVALALRTGGIAVTPEMPAMDARVIDFLLEVADLALHGNDIRERVLGTPTDLAA